MKPLTVVTFCHRGSRPIYAPWHVVNLRAMYAKHLTVLHDFVVVTDDVTPYAALGIRAIPLWASPDPNATNRHWLFNYNRLRLFDPWAAENIGPRLLCSDLDMVIRENIDDLVKDPAPFKAIAMKSRIQLQGAFFIVEPGCVEPNPWTALHEDATLLQRASKWVGSDQAVMSELFYGRVPTWDEDDGLIINQFEYPRWRVFFRTGSHKCWHPDAPERALYMSESGATDDAPIMFGSSRPPLSARTPGGLQTRVRRYVVGQPRKR